MMSSLLRKAPEICDEGFLPTGTSKEQGQRRVNLLTIMTIGEMLEYWRRARGEHLKGKRVLPGESE